MTLWEDSDFQKEISVWSHFRREQKVDLRDADGVLFFNDDTPNCGKELWMSDGTSKGTELCHDIDTVPGGEITSSRVSKELWVTDGTSEKGTKTAVGNANPDLASTLEHDSQDLLIWAEDLIFITLDTLEPGWWKSRSTDFACLEPFELLVSNVPVSVDDACRLCPVQVDAGSTGEENAPERQSYLVVCSSLSRQRFSKK